MEQDVRRLQGTAPPENAKETCIAGEVVRALRSTGRFSPRQLHVTVTDDVVVLRGCVASYYQKQAAQAAASAVTGSRELRNEVEVR